MKIINKLEEVRSHLSDAKRSFNELKGMDHSITLPHLREAETKLMEANFYLNDMHEMLSAISELES